MKATFIKFLAVALGCFCVVSAFAAEVIPPAPAKYFNDYAGVVSPATAARLNSQLEQFEREAYNQIIVAIFPKMQSDSSVEDYTVRIANAWQVGQKDKRNGAVLFVFVQDHKMYLQVGYGLEGAIPDAISKRIIEDEIKPRFKAGDFDGGLTAGVNAILAASKGEYRGTGRTVADRGTNHQRGPGALIPVIIFIVILVFVLSRPRGGGGLLSTAGWILSSGGGNNWSGGRGGGWSGGGSSGGGGGFSGGGGGFGGGGAGGSW